MTDEPRIGDDVHYVDFGSRAGEFPQACRAAKVTEVLPQDPEHHDWLVGLKVWKPWGDENWRSVEFHEGFDTEHDDVSPTDLCHGRDYPGGTWHWRA